MAPAVYLDANILIGSVEGPDADFLRLVRGLRARLSGCAFLVSNDKRLRDKGPIERLSIVEAAERLRP